MIFWEPFSYKGETYSLDHLHPMTWVLTQEAKGTNPSRNYRIDVVFSLHTFTQSREGHNDKALFYSDQRETRSFCFNRYEQSKLLPDIIHNLEKGYVFHTGHQNFLRIDKDDGIYEVYFVVSRSNKPGFELSMYVQSAYKRTKGNTPNAGKIKFYIVAYNTLHNKLIKPPRR